MVETIGGGYPVAELIAKPSFIRDGVEVFHVEPDTKTLAEMVLMAGFKTDNPPVVWMDGEEVEPEQWGQVIPGQAHVVIANIPRGGGDSKTIIKLVAIIALAIAAPYAAAAMGLTGVSASAAAAVIVVAGTLAINAIFPPPAMDFGTGSFEESPSQSLSGQRNAIRPGSPVPRIYGKHRVWPMNGATPFIQTIGKRNQYLYMILDFGYAPLVIRDIRVEDTPINQYRDVSMVLHKSIRDAEDLHLYTNDINTQNLALDMIKDQPLTQTTDPEADGVQLDFTFPAGLMSVDKKGRYNQTTVTFKAEFKKSTDTEWTSFYKAQSFDFSRDVKIRGAVPGVQTEGTEAGRWGLGYNVGGVDTTPNPGETVVEVIGQPYEPMGLYDKTAIEYAREPVLGYPEGATSMVVNTNAETPAGTDFFINGQRYTTTTITPAGDQVSLEFSPALVSDIVTTLSDFERVESSEYNATGTVKFIPGFNWGGFLWWGTPESFDVKDATQEPFTVQLNLNFEERGQYDLRITRLTEGTRKLGKGQVISDSTWSSLRTVTHRAPFKFRTDHTVLELKIKATDQLNQVLDRLSAIASSELVAWNGTGWDLIETRNPAWIAWDILTGPANSQPLHPAFIDLESFYQWALFCDQTAGNADEPRFLCDCVVDYPTTTNEVLKNVMSAGRASLTIKDGRYSVIYDEMPTIPRQIVTPQNSWNFQGSRLFGEEPHAVQVEFMDPDSGWSRREVTVYNDGYDDVNATNYQNLSLFGITRATQAWRDGRYHLAQAILRQEEFSLMMDLENLVTTRGDYFQVQHDVPRVGGLPARISEVNGRQITATEPFTMDIPANSYQVSIRQEDQIITYGVVAQIDSYTIEIDGDGIYKTGDLIVWGILDTVTEDFLLAIVEPGEDLTARLKLIPLAPPVYTSDTGTIPPYRATLSPDLSVNAPLVTGLSVTDSLEYIERFPHITLILSWTTRDQAISETYEIYRYIGEKWTMIGTTRDLSFFVYRQQPVSGSEGYSILGVEHEFRVLAVTAAGGKHEIDAAQSVFYTPLGDQENPPNVENFSIDVVDKTIHLFWSLPNAPDLDRFVIRYSPQTDSPGWGQSTVLAVAAHNENSTKVNARIGSYMIKAFDTSGNQSQAPAIAITQINELTDLNVIKEIDEAPEWAGVKTNMQADGRVLETIELAPQEYAESGVYEFAEQVDLGEIYESRVTTKIRAFGVLEEDIIANWARLSDVDALSHTDSADWDAFISVAAGQDSVLGGINWTAWKRVSVSDLTARYYKFKIDASTIDPDIRIVVLFGVVRVDMPDRITSDFNLITQAQAYGVTYQPAFSEPPALQITQDDWRAGDRYEITERTAQGFKITFYDNGGNPVARRFDYFAKGYGRQRAAILTPN